MTVMNAAAQVLADLITLRKAKDNLDKKDYKRQKAELWERAEQVVRQNRADVVAGASEEHGGATITHRPDVAYEANRDARSGDYTLTMDTEARNYLGRKLGDDRKEGVPAADRILAGLGFIDN